MNFRGRNPETANPEVERSAILAEEKLGLDKFYAEFNQELLDNNYEMWNSHLESELRELFPDEEQREQAISKAKEFAQFLPLEHGAALEPAYRIIESGKLQSNFQVSKQGSRARWSGNSVDWDQEHERDHFVYLQYGKLSSYFWPNDEGIGSRPLGIITNPSTLSKPGSLVTLEDPLGLRSKLKDRSNENAFKEHKKQTWRGTDFQKIFPLMLAISFDNPNEYFSKKGFLNRIYPEDLKHAYDQRITTKDRYNPEIEVMIPSEITPDEIMFMTYFGDFEFNKESELHELKNKLSQSNFKTLEIKPGQKPQATELIYNKAKQLLSTDHK